VSPSFLDVIYNHAGQQNNRYWQYDGNCSGDNDIHGASTFVHGHHTPWGEGFATWQREIRDFLLDNARLYLRGYRVDGLRFDAVQAIDPDAVRYIVGAVRNEFPDKYMIAEYNPYDSGTSGERCVSRGPLRVSTGRKPRLRVPAISRVLLDVQSSEEAVSCEGRESVPRQMRHHGPRRRASGRFWARSGSGIHTGNVMEMSIC
jgi:hypothetical protein